METSGPVFHQELVLKNIISTYDKYVNLLSPITNVEVGDKISWFETEHKDILIDTLFLSEIYINKPTYYTSVYRWYYNQNREQTLFYIATIKQNYAKFLDDIYYGCSTSYMYKKFNEIAENTLVFNEKLSNGFSNLRETYLYDGKIVDVLNKFINIMREFKTNIIQIRQQVLSYPPNTFFQ
jgi:hypothetical protein